MVEVTVRHGLYEGSIDLNNNPCSSELLAIEHCLEDTFNSIGKRDWKLCQDQVKSLRECTQKEI